MMFTMRIARMFGIVAVIVAAALAGYLLGGSVHTRQHHTLITRELQWLSDCMDAITRIEGSDDNGAKQILGKRVQKSIADLHDLTGIRVRLDEPALIAAVRDAQAYAASKSLTQTAGMAGKVMERLEDRH
jgi:hypothetical protein